MPVLGNEGTPHGVVLSLHDVSPEISLEERCQNLREIATKDPLTQVANRAEFDRTLELFVAAHLENQRPCSLIISDIDRFKSVNDTYGHQAGDEVIQSFARLQQGSCRQGDLVARYGGEEFVLLCADCDNATATRRAEEVREAFAQIPQPMVDNRCVTASFGVTEVQPGDTPETMLRRADRALLLAKENGRNRVVQLGTGCGGANSNSTSTTGESDGGSLLISQAMMTLSGLDRTVEKLKGFIADQHAEIVSIEEGKLRIGFGGGGIFRRATDPGVRLLMDMQLEEDKQTPNEQGRGGIMRMRIHVEIRPQRSRDRRRADALDRARQLMMSVRQYLMATDSGPMIEVPVEPESSLLARVAGNLFPWSRKRGITAEDDR
jgi:diguanylate cyclase (GGDEF)-like protein